MCEIYCKKSTKSGKAYLVLCVNGVYTTFDRAVIEKIALTNGISNIELNNLNIDDKIIIEEV